MDKSKIKIMVIDDEREILEALKTHLELDGYVIKTVDTAKEALAIFQNNPHQIVLMDINMPEMDGLELLEKIKSVRGDTVAIMITAYTSITKVLHSRFYGASDFILKPFEDLSELDRAIERSVEIIERWDKILQRTKELKK